MAKRILTLCLALVIGIAFAMPAAAAVKSIKVGGDLTIRGIYRDNIDFQKDEDGSAEAWLMETTRIWVGAELTDNVSAVIRLLSERDLGLTENVGSSFSSTDIALDLAYLKLKDVLIPGLTATLGRQEILLGEGFVVGNRWGAERNSVGNIYAADYSARKAFDAWRLDYEVGAAPITITLFDAKFAETASFSPNPNSDLDLWGLNVAYKTDNAAVEGYVLLLDTQTGPSMGGPTNLTTIGARVDHTVLAVPGLNYNLEAAMQTGEFWGNDSEGWAGNGDISYTFQNPMQFKLGAAWYYASGGGDEYWIPLYPDNLADRIGRITYAGMLNNMFTFGPGGVGGNMSVPKIYAGMNPSEKHALSLAWFPMSAIVDAGGDDDLGYGLNFGYTYQYTEDVAFGLCVDYASAGDAIPVDDSDSAFQVVATAALSF